MKSKQDQIDQRFLLEDADKNERKARFSEELLTVFSRDRVYEMEEIAG